MAKHYVLIEDSNYSNYPTLIPVRDYLNKHGNPPNNDSLEKELLDSGFTRVASNDNIIFIDKGLRCS